LQAAKLLTLFREYKRRAAVGLGQTYSQKLAVLEDVLLDAREVLFDAAEGGKDAEQVRAAEDDANPGLGLDAGCLHGALSIDLSASCAADNAAASY
jgi:hypothetical protein